MVLVKEGETFSADLVLLTSSNEGDCFIKTSSLDGEKNLKKRIQAKDIEDHFGQSQLDPVRFSKVRGELQCEIPNKDLHMFSG